MKTQFVRLTFLILLGFGFFGCSKENVSIVDDNIVSETTVSGLGPLDCPVLVNECTPNVADALDNMFGDSHYSTPFNQKIGSVDVFINCPRTAAEPCDLPCSPQLLYFDGGSLPAVRAGISIADVPCTVAAQQQLIADLKALALAHAPVCPGTNIKLVPVYYDFNWDYIVGGGGGPIWIFAYVKYAPECQTEDE